LLQPITSFKQFVTVRFYAVRALTAISETTEGRDMIYAEDSTLELLQHCLDEPTLIADEQVLEITCIMLYTLNDDARVVPIIIERGFFPRLLALLP
jgi:hypothetical protein